MATIETKNLTVRINLRMGIMNSSRQMNMKKLLLLRHAKSSWKHAELVDHDRPLNKRGKRNAVRMGKILGREGLIPDVILSSSAVRAMKTAERVAEFCGYAGSITDVKSLYMACAEEYLDALHDLPNDPDVVLLVGHNPGIQECLWVLTKQAEAMPTAALALVELPVKSWSELNNTIEGRLVIVWRPKELWPNKT